MTLDNIKTVFVDLDDTIWWFTENSKLALRHVYDKFGISEYCPNYEIIEWNEENYDINKTINDAYYNYKPEKKYPIVVINIEESDGIFRRKLFHIISAKRIEGV